MLAIQLMPNNMIFVAPNSHEQLEVFEWWEVMCTS